VTGVCEFPALGTTAAVSTTDDPRLEQAVEIVRREVAALDAACSRFRPDSELMAISTGDEHRVSPILADVLAAALGAARSTGGTVDPTVGGALIRLGYDRDFAELGSESAATAPPATVADWRRVSFDRPNRTVRIPVGMVVDVGAVGKAWAADRAARRAAAATGCGVLVNLGGDVSIAGAPPAGGWAIGIADSHRVNHGRVDQTVAVAQGAVATSSVSARAWTHRDRRVHHIVDPATGRPAPIVWRTVSVAAPTCVAANTASTACLVDGRAAVANLARWCLPARLVAADGTAITIGGWPTEGSAG
jgi:thiamine biosynthesis lipoprotein